MYKRNVTIESGFFIVRISYTNQFNNIIEIKHSYNSMDTAERYIYLHLLNWMRDKLKRFIFHKVNLYETSSLGWYNSINKHDSLDQCRKLIPFLQDASLFTITNWILENEKHLSNILPSQRNNSYSSSRLNLQELVWMSIHLRKQQRLQKQTA